MKKYETSILYDSADEFFKLEGNVNMRLTPEAAIEVCAMARKKGFYVGRLEGGVFHDPGFEARIDAIWDCKNYLQDDRIYENNILAIEDLIEEIKLGKHNAFLVTLIPKKSLRFE